MMTVSLFVASIGTHQFFASPNIHVPSPQLQMRPPKVPIGLPEFHVALPQLYVAPPKVHAPSVKFHVVCQQFFHGFLPVVHVVCVDHVEM